MSTHQLEQPRDPGKAPELKFHIVDTAVPYWLKVAPDFKISTRHYPNAWRRFWCWALLGWTWEKP